MNMKSFFICMAAIVASLACSVSCSKDDSDEQPVDVKEQIAEAIKEASLPVCDGRGIEVGTATVLGDGADNFMALVSFAPEVELNLKMRYAIEWGNGHEFVMDDMQMVAEKVAIIKLELKIARPFIKAGVKALQVVADKAPVAEGKEYMVSATGIARILQKGLFGVDVLEGSEVRGNMNQYKDLSLIRFAEYGGKWGASGICGVKEVPNNGVEHGLLTIVSVFIFLPNVGIW